MSSLVNKVVRNWGSIGGWETTRRQMSVSRAKAGKIVLAVLVIVVTITGVCMWLLVGGARESSIRLESKLRLHELWVAVESFRKTYGRVPRSIDELRLSRKSNDDSRFEEYEYVGGTGGVIAYKRRPFRKVEAGEPWGGNGEVAKKEMPASRLVLFSDGSMKFIKEVEFEKRYGKWGRNSTLKGLVPGMEWSKWYQEKSGYRPDAEHFGAYVILPLGDQLYIGFGTGLPSLGDGALIARVRGGGVEVIGSIAEEGIHEMIWDPHRDILHIAGTDPSWPDDWSAGNHYTFLRSGKDHIRKHRSSQHGLANVIHTWGLWLSKDGVLYAAVNSHDGSFVKDRNVLRRAMNRIQSMFDPSFYSRDYGVTRRGQIFSSHDSGETWTYLSDIGNYRAYDIIGFSGRLYAIYTDKPRTGCRLAVSEDGGRKWSDVTNDYIDSVHLVEFKKQLLAVSVNGEELFAVKGDRVTRYGVPEGFRIKSGFDVVAVGDQYLYAIFKDVNEKYFVVRTENLRDWEWMASTHRRLISIAYWPKRKWIVVGDAGIGASVWMVDLKEFEKKMTKVSRVRGV